MELRAATGLADWMAMTGPEEASGKLLRSLYAGFTEGFDTPDLKAARVVLARIG